MSESESGARGRSAAPAPFAPVMMTPQQASARALADEMAYNKEHGIDFGAELEPGHTHFLGEDGETPHGPNGEPMEDGGRAASANVEAAAAEAERANKAAIAAAKKREADAPEEGGAGPTPPEGVQSRKSAAKSKGR